MSNPLDRETKMGNAFDHEAKIGKKMANKYLIRDIKSDRKIKTRLSFMVSSVF